MPKNKSQHYVPRFYLKLFSLHGDGKSIGLVDLPSGRVVESASLANQACQDYFYGKGNDIEEALGLLETTAAQVIRRSLVAQSPPILGTSDFPALVSFVVFLHFRTKRKVDELDELAGKSLMAVAESQGIVPEGEKGFEIGLTNAPLLSLEKCIDCLPFLIDLVPILVKNVSRDPFITSDNPVVLYNQLLESKRSHSGHAGLGSTGVQLIVPLSPIWLLILLDPLCYKTKVFGPQAVCEADENDVYALNLLQALNAGQTLYFGDSTSLRYLDQLRKRAEKHRVQQKTIVEKYRPQGRPAGQREFLVSMGHTHHSIDLSLSFLALSPWGKHYQLHSSMCQPRDWSLLKIYEQFQSQPESERPFRTFWEYLMHCGAAEGPMGPKAEKPTSLVTKEPPESDSA